MCLSVFELILGIVPVVTVVPPDGPDGADGTPFGLVTSEFIGSFLDPVLIFILREMLFLLRMSFCNCRTSLSFYLAKFSIRWSWLKTCNFIFGSLRAKLLYGAFALLGLPKEEMSPLKLFLPSYLASFSDYLGYDWKKWFVSERDSI